MTGVSVTMIIALAALTLGGSALFQGSVAAGSNTSMMTKEEAMEKQWETATLGAGCFWCVEAIFQRLKGVESVVSGYSGGTVKNPTYREVCMGTTGHAEVIQVKFDPDVISFEEILDVFWRTHDPTTLNRQGADVGAQYRSVIFYHSDEQRQTAERVKKRLDEADIWSDPIVTEITAHAAFYPAEAYHQDYYRENPNQSYCRIVINPKLEKFQKRYRDKLKGAEED